MTEFEAEMASLLEEANEALHVSDKYIVMAALNVLIAEAVAKEIAQ
jgi:hypothetical protein